MESLLNRTQARSYTKRLKCIVSLSGIFVVLLGFLAGYQVQRIIHRTDRVNCNQKRDVEATSLPKERSSIDDLDTFHSTVAANVKAENIRDHLRYFSSVPHLAGTIESKEQADYVAQKLRNYGFDKVEYKKYNVLLSYPLSPGKISLFDQDNNELYASTITETVLDETEGDPRSVYPFNAYSPAGIAEGEYVYVNFGEEKDYLLLKKKNISVAGKIAIARYGKNFRGDKANMAIRNGAIGVIFFADPTNFRPSGLGYPHDWSMPDTAVQRGNVLSIKGDALTPGYPSLDGMYRRDLHNVPYLPKIPIQPISFRDAWHLLKDMDGENLPDSSWQGGLNFTYHVTTSTPKTLRMEVDNIYDTREVYNVIGTIMGKTEPDRLVLIGNHRDAWIYGAGDASSGTAAMMEVARVIGEKRKLGWRPHRTLVLCSWDAEEYGVMGSTEWVEEHREILRERAVAYINMDIAVEGNHTLRLKATPLLVSTFFDVVSKTPDPDVGTSLFDTWLVKDRDVVDVDQPRVQRLGSGSDFSPFYSKIGIPAIDFRYTYDKNFHTIPSYPVYHTIHDNYRWMTTFVDPDFRYHTAIARIWTHVTLVLLDAVILPFDLARYARAIIQEVKEFELIYAEILKPHQITFDAVKNVTHDLANSIGEFILRLQSVDKDDLFAARMLNDKMMWFERSFITPEGFPYRPDVKHVIFSPSSSNSYMGKSFPALYDAIFDAQYREGGNWEQVKIQMSVIVHHILMAQKAMKDFTTSL